MPVPRKQIETVCSPWLSIGAAQWAYCAHCAAGRVAPHEYVKFVFGEHTIKAAAFNCADEEPLLVPTTEWRPADIYPCTMLPTASDPSPQCTAFDIIVRTWRRGGASAAAKESGSGASVTERSKRSDLRRHLRNHEVHEEAYLPQSSFQPLAFDQYHSKVAP